MAGSGIQTKREELKESISRWQREISEGKRAPTGLVGISSKLASNLEQLLRDALRRHLENRRVEYDDTLRNDFEGKDLDKLTLGQTVKGFQRLNELGQHKIVRDATLASLWKFNDFRTALAHRQDEYAKDSSTLTDNTSQMLTLADAVLRGASLFDLE